MNRSRLGVVAAVAVLGLAGCGDEPATDATEPWLGPDGPTYTGIEAVLGDDGTTLTVLSDPLPVEGSTGRCAVEVVPEVERETPEEVSVRIRFDTEAERPLFEGCEVAGWELALELAAPIGDRRVRTTGGGFFWQEDGGWVGCGHVVMTCVPGPATCENLVDSVANLDVPRGTSVDVHGCDGTYAVVDADMAARDCPQGQCARVDRMYLVAGEQWDVLYRDRRAGCGDVATIEPVFPVAMCEGLPVP